MKASKRPFVSPLHSFDIYMEHYHQLLEKLRKQTDIRQLKTAINDSIPAAIEAIIENENYDALVVTSTDQHIVWVNNGFKDMTGYSKNYAVGKTPKFLQGSKTSEKTKTELRAQLKKEHRFTGSVINYRKNGETYQCKIKIVPIYDAKNNLKHFLALEKELHAA